MLTLTIRTDRPEAEIGLYNADKRVAYQIWPAHRELAETLHRQLKGLLDEQDIELSDLEAVLIYKGPGSFTGLRIGASVANALAASLVIPVLGASGEDWIGSGIVALEAGKDDHIAVPDYGAEARTTQQKK